MGGGDGGSAAGLSPGVDLEAWNWTEWIAELCGLSGWRWPEIEARTLPELLALGKAWTRFPPLPAVLGGVLGVARQDATDASLSPGPTPQEREWLLRSLDTLQGEGGRVSNLVVQAAGKLKEA